MCLVRLRCINDLSGVEVQIMRCHEVPNGTQIESPSEGRGAEVYASPYTAVDFPYDDQRFQRHPLRARRTHRAGHARPPRAAQRARSRRCRSDGGRARRCRSGRHDPGPAAHRFGRSHLLLRRLARSDEQWSDERRALRYDDRSPRGASRPHRVRVERKRLRGWSRARAVL